MLLYLPRKCSVLMPCPCTRRLLEEKVPADPVRSQVFLSVHALSHFFKHQDITLRQFALETLALDLLTQAWEMMPKPFRLHNFAAVPASTTMWPPAYSSTHDDVC